MTDFVFPRSAVPEFAKESQKTSWDAVVRELEKIEPGYLNRLLKV